jgi:hypothetical protein
VFLLEALREFIEALIRGDRSWWPLVASIAMLAIAIAVVRVALA